MATKIMIDAGHGGYDNGATYNERREKDDTLKLALVVGEKLKDKGIDVTYTRTEDIYQNPNEKARIANFSGCDYFLSIHRNTSPTPNTYSGIETLVYQKETRNEKFAENINSELTKIGFEDLGVNERTNIAVLRKTQMPAFLVEAGFINTDTDNELFDLRLDEIASAIVRGIIKSINQTRQAPFYYRIQVGLFRIYNNAVNLKNQLLLDGYDSDIIQMGDYYAVVTGYFNSLDQAGNMEHELITKGYETLIIAL